MAREYLKCKYYCKRIIKAKFEFEFTSSDCFFFFFPKMYFKVMRVLIEEDRGKIIMEIGPSP